MPQLIAEGNMPTSSTAGRVADDDHLYQTMAAHARTMAMRHGWTTVADQYLAVVERLVMARAVPT